MSDNINSWENGPIVIVPLRWIENIRLDIEPLPPKFDDDRARPEKQQPCKRRSRDRRVVSVAEKLLNEDAIQRLRIVELLRLPIADKMSIFSALRYLPFTVFPPVLRGRVAAAPHPPTVRRPSAGRTVSGGGCAGPVDRATAIRRPYGVGWQRICTQQI